MTDIVRRLRKTNYYLCSKEQLSVLILDAADEIERLTAAAQVGERAKAYDDMDICGTGYLKQHADGSVERIDPNLIHPGKDQDFVFPEE